MEDKKKRLMQLLFSEKNQKQDRGPDTDFVELVVKPLEEERKEEEEGLTVKMVADRQTVETVNQLILTVNQLNKAMEVLSGSMVSLTDEVSLLKKKMVEVINGINGFADRTSKKMKELETKLENLKNINTDRFITFEHLQKSMERLSEGVVNIIEEEINKSNQQVQKEIKDVAVVVEQLMREHVELKSMIDQVQEILIAAINQPQETQEEVEPSQETVNVNLLREP